VNIGKIFAIIAEVFAIYEADQAILEAGQVATSPNVVVGSVGGKELYARVQLCTNPAFPNG
jgi:hypothetical protein